MQKLLIYWVCSASLLVSGCSTIEDMSNSIPNALDTLPLIHRPDIQQGNVITQAQISKLKPGMSKSQAQYVMGTPMLVDVFHQDRWDFLYSMKAGNKDRTQESVTLIFEDDSLIKIEGDYRPQPPQNQALKADKETVVTVPDYTGDTGKGFFSRILDSVGIDTEE